MPTDFDYSLEYLRDEDEELTRPVLSYLTGATSAQARAFAQVLGELTEGRRRKVVEMLVDHAADEFIVDYRALFRSLLHHRDPVVRRKAVEGLWEDGRSDLVAQFCHMLTADEDTLVRAQVAVALGQFVWAYEFDELAERYGQQVRKALQGVIDAAEDDIEVVRRCVEAIGYTNDAYARRVIEDAYHHDNHLMRISAVFAMGRSADPAWRDILLAELDSPMTEMRFEAARACGEVGLKRAVTRLSELIDEPDDDVRYQAIWALGQIGGKRARGVIEQLAELDDDSIVDVVAAAMDELEFTEMTLDLFVHDVEDEEDLAIELSDSLRMLAPDADDYADDDDEDGLSIDGMSGDSLDDDQWSDDPIEII